MSKRQSLEEWIHDAARDVEKSQPLSALTCVHLVNERVGNEVHAIRIDKSRPLNEKEAAGLLQGKAEVYAQDLPNVQTFQVLAFYGGERPEAFFHFTTTGSLEWRNGVTEAADSKGMTQMGMRLLEGIAQRTFGMQQLLFEQGQAINRQWAELYNQQRSERNEYAQENREMNVAIMDLMREKVQLGHEQMMAEKQFDRETEERKKLITFLPVIVNRVLGRKWMPVETEDTAFMEAIGDHLGKLPKEDLAKLSSSLPPSMWALLMDRLTESKQKKNQLAAQEVEGKKLLGEAQEADLLDNIDFGEGKAAE